MAGDSAPVATGQFKVYLLRTSTLQPRGEGFTLGWKLSPRGAVDGARPEESTPTFAEMAVPGTTFEGDWQEKTFFLEPEVRRSIRWPDGFNRLLRARCAHQTRPQGQTRRTRLPQKSG